MDKDISFKLTLRMKFLKQTDIETVNVGDKYVGLTPGMSVTVEIKTGKRRMIQYLLAPLQEYQDESLRER